MSKRRTHSPKLKVRVAMEANSGRKTIQEIATDHAVSPNLVSLWKRQLLDGASELFTRGKKTKDKDEGCQATLKTEPLPTLKSEPPLAR